MELAVYNVQGDRVGHVTPDPGVWEGPVNLKLLTQAVAMYRTNQRAGTASTKTRGAVSGGGKKPWRQKHTGRARAGSIRSPLWRHGGVTFGPHPRHRAYRLPQTLRRRALAESLKGKLRDEELIVLEALRADQPKTKPFAGLADTFQVTRTSLIVLEEPRPAVVKSLRNLALFELGRADDLNALEVLNAQKVLMTQEAFNRVEARLRGAPSPGAAPPWLRHLPRQAGESPAPQRLGVATPSVRGIEAPFAGGGPALASPSPPPSGEVT
jgi:large subunit ribosomal protein L4